MAVGNSAYDEILVAIPGLICDSSLNTSDSANYHMRFVKMTANLTVGLAGASDPVIGVLLNKPTTGHAATVAGAGSVCKVYCNDTISAGALISPDASGYAVNATSGRYEPALALDGGSAGDRITVLVLGGMDKKA